MSSVVTTTYPTLATVANLARVFLNDFQNSGAGIITTDTSPQTLPALNSAIRELYRKLRLVGAPTLIRDNVRRDLPANAVTGPSIQTNLSQQGYFDGAVVQPSPALPSDLLYPMELWEQQTGSSLPFVRMEQPQFGIPSPYQQSFMLGMWEWRGGATFTAGAGGGDALWFIGALVPITIRMRYLAAMLQFTSEATFSSTYIPVMDCEDFLAYRVAEKVAFALFGASPATANLKAEADGALEDLRNEQVRRQQTIEYSRIPYGNDVLGSYTTSNNLI